ncbi:site-specific integrase [Aureivirga marina]|uniref:site-specific integrase n=1 Tax=Aureivirga marina TaxID=1182451 RepID=UPI0018CAACB2|nr:site-specific integrase [Aureivirga marina]
MIQNNYSKKIVLNPYQKDNGTSVLYLRLIQNRKVKYLKLGVSVDRDKFDPNMQRVKGKNQITKDTNLVIDKLMADINSIELKYRLENKELNIEKLIEEFSNPHPNKDFIAFYEKEVEIQKKAVKLSTYKQQKSSLNKLKRYKGRIAFSEIDLNFINDLRCHCKTVEKNNDNTISTLIKNVKKYLTLAEKKGLRAAVKANDIKMRRQLSENRTFLSSDELKTIFSYYESEFITGTHKLVLNRFLFSCFTGIRLSDNLSLNQNQIIEESILFTSAKTGKFQRIKLSKSAQQFISLEGPPFADNFAPQYINRELKEIAKICGITKKLTFHVSRHTFATNFLINGGNVVNLKKLLAHSNIRETMVYVHIVESIVDTEINLLDSILTLE